MSTSGFLFDVTSLSYKFEYPVCTSLPVVFRGPVFVCLCTPFPCYFHLIVIVCSALNGFTCPSFCITVCGIPFVFVRSVYMLLLVLCFLHVLLVFLDFAFCSNPFGLICMFWTDTLVLTLTCLGYICLMNFCTEPALPAASAFGSKSFLRVSSKLNEFFYSYKLWQVKDLHCIFFLNEQLIKYSHNFKVAPKICHLQLTSYYSFVVVY